MPIVSRAQRSRVFASKALLSLPTCLNAFSPFIAGTSLDVALSYTGKNPFIYLLLHPGH
jgi:hypothetical protein